MLNKHLVKKAIHSPVVDFLGMERPLIKLDDGNVKHPTGMSRIVSKSDRGRAEEKYQCHDITPHK